MVMTSMQLHPLFGFAGLGSSGSSSTTSSSSSQSGNGTTSTISNSALASLISIPNGPILPSGLSITVAPPQSTTVKGKNTNTCSSASHDLAKVETKMEIDGVESPEQSPPASPVGASNQSPSHGVHLTAQQQALRALANGLQNINTSSASASAAALNQASLLAAATKLMELNATPVDDLLMQEVTQRLVKMNQEIWHAGGSGQVSSSGGGAGSGGHNNPVTAMAAAVASLGHGVNNAAAGQVNEMKLAEKLVNELAVQQSSRNAFHLNERTLQECWNTLQRVSCMIFMHKSAMQLQQQQQQQHQQQQQQAVAVAAQQVQNHHGISPSQHGLIRAGSVVSSAGSEGGGISKPHQCQQCLKAFSSNHQLVQHVRVHTGEKPYKCSYCDRRFKQLSHVQQHTRLHTGERPYKCHVQECGRAFIQLSNLQQHLRNHDAQLERSKNRPFHCNICGKGFATESSLRTHTAKHAALIGGPNAVTCPICHKLFLGGEALMEHMKHTHKDPNASGVATKRRTANHPCPICGKHYVNEGSLRKHLTCHPETAQLSTSLRMWPCSVCQAVFTLESGLLSHMEQMRMDPKHSFAAQYVLSQAAAERRERENILTAAVVASMNQGQSHPFGGSGGQSLSGLLPMPASPSGSESSGRLSSPLDTNSVLPHSNVLHSSRHSMSSPLDARIGNSGNQNNNNSPNNNSNSTNQNNNNNSTAPGDSSSGGGSRSGMNLGRKDYSASLDKYDYDKLGHLNENNNITSLLSGMRGLEHHAQHGGGGPHNPNNSDVSGKSYHAAMKMAAMLGQGHISAHGHGNMLHHHQGGPGQLHGQDIMASHRLQQADALLRSQAEALRLAVANSNGLNNPNNLGNNSSGGNSSSIGSNGNNLVETLGNQLSLNLVAQQQHAQHHQHQHQQHLQQQISNGHGGSHGMHHPQGLNQQQLNSILSQNSDLSEALLRLDARTLGFPLPAHNS